MGPGVAHAWLGPRECPRRGLTTMVISGLNHTAFDLAICPRKFKGSFSTFFRGCWRPLGTTRSLTIWILSVGLICCPLTPAYLRDRASLRADLGQSRSGNSSLSPGAYRAQSTIAELAVWEIGPSTSVRAPRNYAGRSPQGREDNLRKVAGQIGGLRGPRSARGQPSLLQKYSYMIT